MLSPPKLKKSSSTPIASMPERLAAWHELGNPPITFHQVDIADDYDRFAAILGEHRPDVVFLDIQMPKLNGFEMLELIDEPDRPEIVFTTAYNQYAIDAFKVNSVDYLLKPVKKAELAESINKYKSVHAKSSMEIDYHALSQIIKKEDFQKRIVVKYGSTIKAIEIDDIAYFYSDSGNLLFRTFENNTYPLDFSLEKLEPLLNPKKFYRINRQFIIQYKAIKEMYSYSKSRVRIILEPACELETIASTDRSGDFKKWLTGK